MEMIEKAGLFDYSCIHNVEKKICVVLVTFNRKKLLLELLEAISAQTYQIDSIVIVDNCSSDGTSDTLVEEGILKTVTKGKLCENEWKGIHLFYYLNNENTGGSGGFEKAFSIANELENDFIWAMDDDVEPDPDCLEKLLSEISEENLVCIPSRNDDRWTDKIVTKYNLSNPFKVNLRQYKTVVDSKQINETTAIVVDMPLEGPLIFSELSKKVGPPNSSYFIMFDDTDFAHRLSQYTSIKYVKAAHLHRKLAQRSNSLTEWTWKEYYLLRNSFYFDKLYGENVFVRKLRPLFSCIAKVISALVRAKLFRVRIVLRAYKDSIKDNMGRQIIPGTDVRKI